MSADLQSLLPIGLERERIMLQWDIWRQYIANGGTASWPRDEFEAILDAYDEIIADWRTPLERRVGQRKDER